MRGGRSPPLSYIPLSSQDNPANLHDGSGWRGDRGEVKINQTQRNPTGCKMDKKTCVVYDELSDNNFRKEKLMGVEKWTLWHVGLSVKSIDKAVKYFESLGGKAADRPAMVLDSAKFESIKTYGKTDAPTWKIKIRMLNLGPLTFELTEPVEGDNYNKTFMDKHGEGPNHIAYLVDELEKEVAELEAKGVPAMYHAKGQYAYMDARKVGGVVIELKQSMPPGPPPKR